MEKSTLRNILPQIIAVSVKNLLMFEYGLTLGLPTILIPGLSGNDPTETILLDSEAISWISKYFCILYKI